MFSDPKFWVAISFIIFVAVIFNPIRKILGTNMYKKTYNENYDTK